MKPKILFILKRRQDFDPTQHTVEGMQTGLWNSASFVHKMLLAEAVESKMVVVIDNNCIDRQINEYKPTHVIIEALWVVPQKFIELQKLHPNVKWIIRLHSEIPFLAQEGMCFDWLGDYARLPNMFIAANAPRALEEVRLFLKITHGWSDLESLEKVIYLPNYYPQFFLPYQEKPESDEIHVGCFGAIRPLKNHTNQAFAALKFADYIGKKLRFHVNARIECKADPIVNSLKGMFQHLVESGHSLVFDTWRPRDEFLEHCRTMDIGMQVSYSETFNIVGCDLISQGIPIIGSAEIPWMNSIAFADPTTSENIFKVLKYTWENKQLNVNTNQEALIEYGNNTKAIWLEYFSK